MKMKALMLVGGPRQATEFRPLSMEAPKPLFPIAGIPSISHHLLALNMLKEEGLQEVIIIGDYECDVFEEYIRVTQMEMALSIKYVKEETPLGKAGALFNAYELFSDVDILFVLHADIACEFPLSDILAYHLGHHEICTVMTTKVSEAISVKYGCCVSDDNLKMVHYIDHPESFISRNINTGVYCFNASFFREVPQKIVSKTTDIFDLRSSLTEGPSRPGFISMERDLLPYLASSGHVYTFSYDGFWRSIKNAGSVVYCNSWKLGQYAKQSPEMLTHNVEYDISTSIVHESAQVSPSAKIGPNVYIGPNVKIGVGARISNSIILEDVTIQDHSCVLYSIISERCNIGMWSRLEGIPHNEDLRFAQQDERYQRFGITVLGSDVEVSPEIIIRNCIVMPNKEMRSSTTNEIIL